VVALPEGARAVLSLEPPESIVEVWQAARRSGGRLVPRQVEGYLVLTSERVAFVQVVGMGKRRTFHLLPHSAFALESVTELREDPPGTLRLSDSEFRLRGPTAPAARELIERYRVERLRQLSSASPRPAEPTGLTVTTERIIIREVVKVPCRYCGALNDHGAVRCQVCGAPAAR
jgi:hypothetical protein